ncbi:MAG TPA: AsmA family protein, partial [Kofleriaceae bacterium]|nr:AsmA family protein [Kofleriaceae bacterium]
MASSEVRGWRRGLRWTKRIVLGLLAVVEIAIVTALIFIHTDYGRDVVRAKVVDQLQHTFINGATIGKLEGSPFTELVLRDVVINGPDHRPAITVGTLRVSVRLFALIDKRVKLSKLVAEDVDVAVKRDAQGRLEIGQLTKPSDPNDTSKSTWNIELPQVQVRRAHVSVDTGSPDLETVDLDDLELDANAHVPADGERAAGIRLSAMWRQRHAPIRIATTVRDDGQTATVPTLQVNAGDVSVTGSNLEIARHPGHAPSFAGLVQVVATSANVAALVPRIDLPADVALAIEASSASGQRVALSGTIGSTPVHIEATGDLDAKRFAGKLSTGELDISTMTRGKVEAIGGVSGTFEVAMGAAGSWPDATLRLAGRGRFGDLPTSEFSVAVDAKDQHVTSSIDVTGAAKATITAELRRAADAITLERASIVASTRDPAKASGGKAPVHGSLDIAMTAHGALSPKPSLAVAGTINGKRLRMKDLSVASVDVKIDAKQLP